jgi:hypothetical protein
VKSEGTLPLLPTGNTLSEFAVGFATKIARAGLWLGEDSCAREMRVAPMTITTASARKPAACALELYGTVRLFAHGDFCASAE